MKWLLSILFSFLVNTMVVHAQSHVMVDKQSSIQFKIKNFGVNTSGNFSGLNGVLFGNLKEVTSWRVSATLNASSVNTGITLRDDHLKGADYFDVQKFPLLQFTSDKIVAGNNRNEWIAYGKLTIKNITKEIQVPFTISTQGAYLFLTGNCNINRKDFKVGGNSTVSNAVNLMLKIAVQQ